MKNSVFGSVKVRRPGRNAFNLSHEKKLSLNMGPLYPILTQEVLPGDSFKVNAEIMMRLSPMIAPMMHRVNVYTHFFFVPNRIIWDEWEDFITGGPDGNSAPAHPSITINEATKSNFAKKSLADYMGVPVVDQTQTIQNVDISSLPFRAYTTIFNEYYRDQNLSDEIEVFKGSGPEPSTSILQMRTRAWEKDYYTSALPWAQRGGEVGIPVEFNYTDSALVNPKPVTGHNLTAEAGTGEILVDGDNVGIENLEEDGVTVNINDLRKSVRLQEWLELAARGGSRYREQLKTFFGINGGDARLQRPEYLGGGRNPVVVSEVLSTVSDSDAATQDFPPQGNMSGHGISVGRSNSFSRKFKEHGHIIGIMSVLPRTAYQQGLNRAWKRFDKFDYYFPQFAQIGEQEVLNQEVYLDFADNTLNADTWGYQSRYAEYKYKESSVHGDFRDNLNYWHMGRIFTQLPPLNENFVASDPTQRVFAVTDPDEDKLYVQIYNNVKAVRPIPYHNIPTL